MENDIEEQEDIVKELKYEYDRVRYNYHNKDELNEAEKLWKDQKKKLDDMQFKYDKLENDIVRDNELLDKEEEYLELAELDLLIFIDELIDSGMDASGVESSMAILKKMAREHNKSVWLVSHKDELSGRVNNIMTVTKENGLTTYGTEVDIVWSCRGQSITHRAHYQM